MNSKPLRLGFIGGGINSAVGTTHKIASQMDNRWEIVSGCFSKHLDINTQTGDRWKVSPGRVHATWQQMLENDQENLDAIVVLTPTPSHADIVLKVLDCGIPVICEKALTPSSAQAKAIQESAVRNNSVVFVTYNYTGYPMIRELKAMIEQGKLGKISHIQIEMPQEGYLRHNSEGKPNRPQEWRLKDPDIPVVSLDLGTHLHNMIYFLTGAHPVSVIGDQYSYGFFDVIDHVTCQACYTDELSVQMWYGKSSLGYRNGLRVRVFGEHGAAEWYQMDPEHMKISDNLGNILTVDRSVLEPEVAAQERYNRFKAGHPSGFIEAFGNYYNDIADALQLFKQNGTHASPYVFGAEHAAQGLKMLEAIARSATTRQWESIDEA